MPKQNKEEEEGDVPKAPKRPLSAFFLFREQKFHEVKQKNPTAKITQIVKIIRQAFLISKQWANVQPDKKKQYQERYNQNKKTYDQSMKEYQDKYGKPVKKQKKIKKKKEEKDTKKKMTNKSKKKSDS